MSHAWTSIRRLVGSLLTKETSYGRTHTANAATVSEKHEVRSRTVGMANCFQGRTSGCTSLLVQEFVVKMY